MYELKTAAQASATFRLSDDSSSNQIAELVVNSSLFQDLTWREAETLSRYLKLCSISEGSNLFREGERGDFMALIIEGAIEITKMSSPQNSVKVAIEGAGRIIGEMALVDGEPRSATVKFTRPGKILVLSVDHFDELRTCEPRLGASILSKLCRMLSQRLRRTTGLLSEQLAAS